VQCATSSRCSHHEAKTTCQSHLQLLPDRALSCLLAPPCLPCPWQVHVPRGGGAHAKKVEENIRSVEEEVQLLQQFDHPNIVRYLVSWAEHAGGLPCLPACLSQGYRKRSQKWVLLVVGSRLGIDVPGDSCLPLQSASLRVDRRADAAVTSPS